MALAASTLLAACDQGKQDNQETAGPQIRILKANVGAGETLAASGTIKIAVDRLLNPFTIRRQSVQLTEAGGRPLTPAVDYDPVARVITLSADPNTPDGWLKPGQAYELRFGLPANGDDDVFGLRAIDRATINPDDAMRKLAFQAVAPTNAEAAPTMAFCSDVLPIFQRSCSAATCHGTPRPSKDTAHFGENGMSKPAAGLILEFSEGVKNTAIGRVANGSNTGGFAGKSRSAQRLFGIDMPIIDPGAGAGGDPSNSWLLYKVMLAKPATGASILEARRAKCDGSPGTPPQAVGTFLQSTTLDDAERAILSDYVLGREMPYPDLTPTGVADPQSNPGLTFEELERIRLWIAQGARIAQEGCGACEP